MVNRAKLSLMTLLFCAVPLVAQQQPDLERRIVELERKMKLLDPSFRSEPDIAFAERLKVLESKIDELLLLKTGEAPRAPSVTASAALAPSAPSNPLQAVSVSGDYQKSTDSETRLPVAGYMDMHFNKDRGDAFRPDFHRFVLLFGHSFSDRIKF